MPMTDGKNIRFPARQTNRALFPAAAPAVLLLSALLVLFLAGCGGGGGGAGPGGSPTPNPGATPGTVTAPAQTRPAAPAFTAADLFTGAAIKFPEDFRGRVVYLTFFADG